MFYSSKTYIAVNSLALGRFGCNLKLSTFKLISIVYVLKISYEIAFSTTEANRCYVNTGSSDGLVRRATWAHVDPDCCPFILVVIFLADINPHPAPPSQKVLNPDGNPEHGSKFPAVPSIPFNLSWTYPQNHSHCSLCHLQPILKKKSFICFPQYCLRHTGSNPGAWFNIKMSSYQYRKPHCGDKTILRPSYFHNGISYTGEVTSLYWIRGLVLSENEDLSPFDLKSLSFLCLIEMKQQNMYIRTSPVPGVNQLHSVTL